MVDIQSNVCHIFHTFIRHFEEMSQNPGVSREADPSIWTTSIYQCEFKATNRLLLNEFLDQVYLFGNPIVTDGCFLKKIESN